MQALQMLSSKFSLVACLETDNSSKDRQVHFSEQRQKISGTLEWAWLMEKQHELWSPESFLNFRDLCWAPVDIIHEGKIMQETNWAPGTVLAVEMIMYTRVGWVEY